MPSRKVAKKRVNKQLTTKAQGGQMKKLVIDKNTSNVEDINQEIMIVALKVLSMYRNDSKVCYFSKWKPFFNGLFPSQVAKTKGGPWIAALSSPTIYAKDQDGNQYIKMEGALAYLTRQGFIQATSKEFTSGYTGKLYNIKEEKVEAINNIFNNFIRDFDDQLAIEIEAFYDKEENNMNTGFKAATSSFSAMGFEQ